MLPPYDLGQAVERKKKKTHRQSYPDISQTGPFRTQAIGALIDGRLSLRHIELIQRSLCMTRDR